MTTVLVEPVAAPAVAMPKAVARPPCAPVLPIVIEPTRGGIFRAPVRRPSVRAGSARAASERAEENVLRRIWPLIDTGTDRAPGAAAAAVAGSACSRLRATISAAVASFRVRLGRIAAAAGDADRIAIEDLALTLRVDEGELLGRTIDALAPEQLLAASLGRGEPRLAAVDHVIAARIDAHLRSLVQDGRQLREATRARLLEALTQAA